MAGYKSKTEVDLAWLDNRDQVKLDIRKVARRLENEVFGQLDREFEQALARGEILELRPPESEIARLLRDQALRLEAEINHGQADES